MSGGVKKNACYIDVNMHFYKKNTMDLNSIYESMRRYRDINLWTFC